MADRNNDIEKYLRGDLSPAEMHALEKEALDDPFLADALAGASQLSPAAFTSDMSFLSAQLKARSAKKVIPLWVKLSRIAAVFLAVALCTFVVINIVEKDKPDSVAQGESEAAPSMGADSIKDDGFHNKPGEQATEQLLASEETKPRGLSEKSRSGEKPVKESIDGVAVEEVEQQQIARREENTEPEIADLKIDDEIKTRVAQQIPQDNTADKTDAIGLSKQKAPAGVLQEPSAVKLEELTLTKSAIRGKVTDATDGKGVPGVNVMIRGSSMGTVTNAEGYYEIVSNEPATSLVFSFIGYESKEVDAGASAEVNVSLDHDVAELSEIVVVGYGEGSEKPSTYEMAGPEGGRKAFQQYLEQSIQYPEQAIKNNVEGKVMVQFTVETSGRLSDFKVIKGIGYGCDEELIRLIKQGPQWTPTKRDAAPLRDRVKVRLKFTLPKK